MRALGQKLSATLASALSLPPGAEAELSALVEAQCRVALSVEPRRTGTVRLVPVELLMANPEPGLPVVAAIPRFLEGFVGQTRVGRAFNEPLARWMEPRMPRHRPARTPRGGGNPPRLSREG